MRQQAEKGPTGSARERRTLKVEQWPGADQLAWQAACKPSDQLKKGGTASHLAPESQNDIAARYGLFLGFLKQIGCLDHDAPPAGHVTPENIKAYLDDVSPRVRSVTAWNHIYKVRRAAQLIAPDKNFSWLQELENDLAFVMEPRSKFDRIVLTERLVEAGLTLMEEAKTFTKAEFVRARGIRNGLMIAMLALVPIRRKNFATMEIGESFRKIQGKWWITISAGKTKSRQRPEERPIADWLTPYIELYLNKSRPILLTGSQQKTDRLWISTVTRGPMTEQKLGSLITQITKQTLGIAISPHLFRTAGATTAADAKGDMPKLASALLGHTHPRITEENYIRASSIHAGSEYANIIRTQYGSSR